MLVERFSMSPYARLLVLPDVVRGVVAAIVLICVSVPMADRVGHLAFMATLVLLFPLAWWIGAVAERMAYRVVSRLS